MLPEFPPIKRASKYKNKVRVGADEETLFVSLKGQDGNYYWKRIKDMDEVSTPDEYWLQFPKAKAKPFKYDVSETLAQMEEIMALFKQRDVLVLRVGWDKVYNFLDFAWTEAMEQLKTNTRVAQLMMEKDTDPEDVVSFIFWSANLEYSAKRTGELCLQHSIMEKDVEYVKQSLYARFGKRLKWNGSSADSIIIKL